MDYSLKKSEVIKITFTYHFTFLSKLPFSCLPLMGFNPNKRFNIRLFNTSPQKKLGICLDSPQTSFSNKISVNLVKSVVQYLQKIPAEETLNFLGRSKFFLGQVPFLQSEKTAASISLKVCNQLK